MTCIAGWVDPDGSVTMGGDSAGIGGWTLTVRSDPKVFEVARKNEAFLIGYTSSFRMGQLLRYKLEPPEQPDGMSDHEYMCTLFIDAVRETFKAGGFAEKEKEQESGGFFLVGYRGHLYEIADDYQVGEAIAPFESCGCGQDAARGAFHALQGFPGLSGRERVETALRAAEALSAGVRGPFGILTLGPPAPKGVPVLKLPKGHKATPRKRRPSKKGVPA